MEALADIPGEVGLRIAPVLAEMQAARAAIEKAGARPLITSGQIRTAILPELLAAWSWGLVVFGVVLLGAAFGAGWGVHWWVAPKLTCQKDRGGVACYYWKVQPTEPPAETAPSVQKPAAQSMKGRKP